MGSRHQDEPAMRMGKKDPEMLQRELQRSPYSVALKRDARNRKYELGRHAQLREQVETVVLVDHLARLALGHGVAVDAEQFQGARHKAVWAKAKALAVLEAVEMVAPSKKKKHANTKNVEDSLNKFLDTEGGEGGAQEEGGDADAPPAEGGEEGAAGGEEGGEAEAAAPAAEGEGEGGEAEAPAGEGEGEGEAQPSDASDDPYGEVRNWGTALARGGKVVHTLEQVRKNVAGVEEGDNYSLYTEESIMRRHVLRADPAVVEALERHWGLLKCLIEKERAVEATKMPTPGTPQEGKRSPDNTIQLSPKGSTYFRTNGVGALDATTKPKAPRVSSAVYRRWNARVHLALVPLATKLEAKVAAGREWEQEIVQAHLQATTDKRLDKTCMMDIIFQLADMWTQGCEAAETIAFLDALLLSIADEAGEALRPLDQVPALAGDVPEQCRKLYDMYLEKKQGEMTKRNLLKPLDMGDTEDTMAIMFDRERLARKANVWERKSAQLEKYLAAGQPTGSGQLVGHPFAQGVTLVGQGKKIYNLVHKEVEEVAPETEAGAEGEAEAGAEGEAEAGAEGEAEAGAEGEEGGEEVEAAPEATEGGEEAPADDA